MVIKISKKNIFFFARIYLCDWTFSGNFGRIYFREFAIFRFFANTYFRELPFCKFFAKSYFRELGQNWGKSILAKINHPKVV